MLIAFCALALLAAVFAQMRQTRQNIVMPRTISLAALLPVSPEGYSTKDLPIADTEEMQRAVDEYLFFNEALFRSYRKNDDEINVYVAYWEPGRYHPRLIASHVPDNCWVAAGWEMQQRKETRSVHVIERSTLPGECRSFSRGTTVNHVIYWHIVGGKISIYSRRDMGPWDMFFTSFLNDITSGQTEHYFIRISSNRPIADLEKNPLFKHILTTLAQTGLLSDISQISPP